MKRAGADLLITYHALDVARWIFKVRNNVKEILDFRPSHWQIISEL
jgi:hypothetical protein